MTKRTEAAKVLFAAGWTFEEVLEVLMTDAQPMVSYGTSYGVEPSTPYDTVDDGPEELANEDLPKCGPKLPCPYCLDVCNGRCYGRVWGMPGTVLGSPFTMSPFAVTSTWADPASLSKSVEKGMAEKQKEFNNLFNETASYSVDDVLPGCNCPHCRARRNDNA